VNKVRPPGPRLGSRDFAKTGGVEQDW